MENGKNGTFRLVNMECGFGLQLVPPANGGEAINIKEIGQYLDHAQIVYDINVINQSVIQNKENKIYLGAGVCPAVDETVWTYVAPDNMSASVKFIQASETGKRIDVSDVILALKNRGVVHGICMENLNAHFQSQGIYNTCLLAAQGKAPRQGTDAAITYFFNTNLHIQPTLRADGTVDYFHLNLINSCKKGEELARVTPADVGEPGINVLGNKIKPRDVRRVNIKYGNNISLSEDRLSAYSMVDGHVMLVEDKIFVSDVYTVENVDLSTGDIEFQGSVMVNGNVTNNMKIKAGGNVIVNGVVECAQIEAGGNIIIARGMNGMGRGSLKSGGNIVAKFIESSSVTAEGYVNSESLLYCNVCAGTSITVEGKKGFVTGGHIQAADKVEVKNLGAQLGTPTIVEVGVKPQIKSQYIALQREISETVKKIKAAQPVIANFNEKRAKGVRFSADQVQYVKSTAVLLEEETNKLQNYNLQLKSLQVFFEQERSAEVIVRGTVSTGTTIVIGDISMTVQNEYQYCKFIKAEGSISMVAL